MGNQHCDYSVYIDDLPVRIYKYFTGSKDFKTAQ